MKKILVLGAGLVSKPGVRYLLNDKELNVTVASRTVSKAERLVEGFDNGFALHINVKNEGDLESLIKQNDIIVSLLPWIFHVKVAKLCLKNNINMATTSYVREEMKELDKQVKKKGLLFLNEVGVDPGIDHMSAMSIIDHVHEQEGKIVDFYSFCGGLPAPDNNDNPFGYKFSWSPKGVLLASRNSAKFLEHGKIVEIDGKDLFSNYRIEEVDNLGKLEVYANRDSMPYRDIYGLNEAETVMRGTYRYPGWCDTLKKMDDLGLIDETPRENLKSISFRNMIAELVKCDGKDDVIAKTAERIGLSKDSEIINKNVIAREQSDRSNPNLNRRTGVSPVYPIPFDLVSNPEFLREGSAVYDFTHPDKIVIGTTSPKALKIIQEIYRPLYLIDTPFVITNPETAELIKYA